MYVALRKESVDRNRASITTITTCTASLSARRAWIEIVKTVFAQLVNGVSLSARRAWIEIGSAKQAAYFFLGRSPQGERG